MNPFRALRRSVVARTRAALAAAERIAHPAPPTGLESLESRTLLSSVTLTNETDYVILDNSTTGGSSVVRSTLPHGSVVTGIDVTYQVVHSRGSDLRIVFSTPAPRPSGSYTLQPWPNNGATNLSGSITGITQYNGTVANGAFYIAAVDNVAGETGYIDRWSITIHYEEALPPPQLISPLGTTVTTTRPTLTWNTVPGATGYKVYLADTDYVPIATYTIPDGNATSFTVPDGVYTANGSRTNWTVTTLDSQREGPRGAYRAFTLPNVNVPWILEPGDSAAPGPLLTTLRPTFEWIAVSQATSYQLRLQNLATGAVQDFVVLPSTGGNNVLFTPPQDLAGGDAYRWQARAIANAGPSAWSAFDYFQTAKASLGIPATIGAGSAHPEDFIANQVSATPPTLSWHAVPAATGYRVYVERPGSLQKSYDVPAGQTSFSLPTADFAAGLQYAWRVTSLQGTSQSVPSETRYFFAPSPTAPTFSGLAPGSPTAPGTVLTTPTPTFSWTASDSSWPMVVGIRNLDTGEFFSLPRVSSSSTSIEPGLLVPGHRYVWTVTPSVQGQAIGRPSAEQYFRVATPITSTKLTGTIIGTAGSYKDRGATRDKVFDGNLSTYFDGPSSSGVWAGLDLGSAKTITKARFVPRAGSESRMVGGKFQVSTNGSTWTDLATITATPASGWNELSFSNTNAYRYVRYLSPSGSYGNVAEIEFWGVSDGSTPLTPADLVAQNLVVTPGTATAGASSSINVRFTVRNNGQTASNRSSFVVDLINAPGSTTPSYLDTLLSGITIPSIPAGGTYEFNLNASIKTSTPAGNYLVRVTLDPNRDAGQSGGGLSNDMTSASFTVEPAAPALAPDLVVQNVDTGFNSAVQGGTFNLYFGVRNVGNAASTATTGRVVLRNASGQQVAVLASDYAIAGLGVNAYGFFPRTLTIPASVPPGTYSIAIQIDVAGTAGQPAAARGNDTFVTPLTFTVTADPNQPQVPAKLTGTVIGTTGSYKNNGNTRDKVFDGNTSTYFDGPSSNSNWVGLDLGSAKTITKARYVPRANVASRMVGGKFQASTDGVSWIDLGTITQTPGSSWNELAFSNPNAYRYVRYLSPSGSYGNVAEIEFWGTGGGTTPQPTPAADLVVAGYDILPSAPAGGSVPFLFGVRNQGTGDSKGTVARIFLRASDGSETNLATGVSLPSVVAGTTITVQRTLTIPANLAPGVYNLGVQLDTSGLGWQAPGANANDTSVAPYTFTVLPGSNPPAGDPAKLTGAVIGSAGSYKNSGNTRDKAFDGNTSTYFDGPSSSGMWVGLDLGSAKTITKARYVPRSGSASRMVGGKFQASTDGLNWVDLGTITGTPGSSWNEMSFTNANAYRYVRYLGPTGSNGNVAEVEFWGTA